MSNLHSNLQTWFLGKFVESQPHHSKSLIILSKTNLPMSKWRKCQIWVNLIETQPK